MCVCVCVCVCARAAANMIVLCSSLISRFSGTLIKYFLKVTEMALFAPIIIGNIFVFVFHMHCISIESSLHFRIF